jgi:hypothetical protein
MKKLIFLILVLAALTTTATSQNQYPSFVIDTVRFVRGADSVVYTSGDMIADSGSHTKYLTFNNVGRTNNSRGKITFVTVQDDSANATNKSVKVRFFDVSDTTGLWAQLPADNAVFQSKFQLGAGYYRWYDDVTVTQTVFGTTAGGATASEGTTKPTIPIPFELLSGKLRAVVIANGAFEPSWNAHYRIIIGVDRQN